MTGSDDLLLKRVLDGELGVSDLPVPLRRQAEAVLRLLEALDRDPVSLPETLETRVMAAVRRRAESPAARAWRWMDRPREVRVRVRAWMLGPALAVAAALALILGGTSGSRVATPATPGTPGVVDSMLVRFVLYAPEAGRVALAGTFNEWDPAVAPLVRSGAGVWTTTVVLPTGQHQYAFVVDGDRWVADPAAPLVDDGFGQGNSVLSIEAGEQRL